MNFGLGMLDEITCFSSEGSLSPFCFESKKWTSNLSTQHIL